MLEIHSRVEPVVVGVLEAETLDVDIIVASPQNLLQLSHDGDEVRRHSLGPDPGHSGHSAYHHLPLHQRGPWLDQLLHRDT